MRDYFHQTYNLKDLKTKVFLFNHALIHLKCISQVLFIVMFSYISYIIWYMEFLWIIVKNYRKIYSIVTQFKVNYFINLYK